MIKSLAIATFTETLLYMKNYNEHQVSRHRWNPIQGTLMKSSPNTTGIVIKAREGVIKDWERNDTCN